VFLGILSLAKPSKTTSPAPSVERIRELFSAWETGQGLEFIDTVLAPDCKFIIPGSPRYAGVYDREGIKAVELEVFEMFKVAETFGLEAYFGMRKGSGLRSQWLQKVALCYRMVSGPFWN
jgi:hypothetical protein